MGEAQERKPRNILCAKCGRLVDSSEGEILRVQIYNRNGGEEILRKGCSSNVPACNDCLEEFGEPQKVFFSERLIAWTKLEKPAPIRSFC